MSLLAGLALVFIHLKLSEKIDWPWFLVLSPYIFNVIINIAEKASNKS